MVAEIPIHKEEKMFALVDDDMAKAVGCFRWSLSDKGEPRTQHPNPDHPKLYMVTTLKAYVMKERVVSPWVIKNLNGNPLDCRRENLKKMTLKESRALDVKNFGPRETAKKVQKKWTRKLMGRSARPERAKFKFFD